MPDRTNDNWLTAHGMTRRLELIISRFERSVRNTSG